jgi:hypothetical protein
MRESLVGFLKILLIHSQWHAPTVSALSTGQPGDEEKVTMQNYIRNALFECIVSTPKTLDNLLDVMAKAKWESLNIKAVGSFHVFSSHLYQFVAEHINPLCSPVCKTIGYLINADLLTGMSHTPTATLKDPSQGAELYDVLSRMKLKQLIQALEKDGRALKSFRGFTGLPHFALFQDSTFANLLYRPENNQCHSNRDYAVHFVRVLQQSWEKGLSHIRRFVAHIKRNVTHDEK